MKSMYLPIAVAFGSTVYAAPSSTAGWVAPSASDVRGPCPMLNTLANHGFLPHTGKGITVNKTIDALGTALNIDQPLSEELFSFAVTTNPSPNSTWFDLNHLSRHNILEHDGSLSRQDSYFGPADVFNETVFNQTKSYWTGDTITVQMASNARVARLMTSNLTNPEYSLSDLGSAFSIGESGAYVAILGDKKSGTVPKAWVEYLFENERLPYELGFTKAKEPFVEADLGDMMDRIVLAQHFPQLPGKVGSVGPTGPSTSKRSVGRCPYH